IADRLIDHTEQLRGLAAGGQAPPPPLARADEVKHPGQDARAKAAARAPDRRAARDPAFPSRDFR
ncbi:MAG: hypothetical protein ACREEE_09205, partial [Dongiaceae bacterium]